MQNEAGSFSRLPCMRGQLVFQQNHHSCSGRWAMSAAAHATPCNTSPFEFHLVAPASNSITWPVNGKYTGWFMVKLPPPKHPVKIQDREITLIFRKNECGFAVNGFGVNKFGKFSMTGTLTDEGDLELFRSYEDKKGSGSGVRKRCRSNETIGTSSPGQLKLQSSSTGVSDEIHSTVHVKRRKAHSSSSVNEHRADPPSQLSEDMKRCSDILNQLLKDPYSKWFREPVNPQKLGVPDYFDVVKDPMDFSTIQQNLIFQQYETPEAFAEHVRLVFRNAIAYNNLRTSPVHVAARELSARFEEKYAQALLQSPVSAKTGGNKGRMKSHSSTSSMMDSEETNSNSDILVEMQRRMQEMQRTIHRLEAEVKTQDSPNSHPQCIKTESLTMTEKRTLIQRINKLPAEKLGRVAEIVKDALPTHTDEEDDVEIPLDNLDSATLMKLQNYVESCAPMPRKHQCPLVVQQSFGACISDPIVDSAAKRHKTSRTDYGNYTKDEDSESSPHLELFSDDKTEGSDPRGTLQTAFRSVEHSRDGELMAGECAKEQAIVGGNGMNEDTMRAEEHHLEADFGSLPEPCSDVPSSPPRTVSLSNATAAASFSANIEKTDGCSEVEEKETPQTWITTGESDEVVEHNNPSGGAQNDGDDEWEEMKAQVRLRTQREALIKQQEEMFARAREEAWERQVKQARALDEKQRKEAMALVEERAKAVEEERAKARQKRMQGLTNTSDIHQLEAMDLILDLL